MLTIYVVQTVYQDVDDTIHLFLSKRRAFESFVKFKRIFPDNTYILKAFDLAEFLVRGWAIL